MPRTTYRVVLWVTTLGFVCLGSHPTQSQSAPDGPPVLLLPAEQAWLVPLPSAPSANGALDTERVYVPIAARSDNGGTEAAGAGSQVLALGRETGDMQWTRDVETSWPPVAAHGLVFVAGRAELHALEAVNGNHRWRAPLGRPLMAPMVTVGRLLIVPITPDGLLAFDVESGALVWQQSLGGSAGPVSLVASADAIYLSLPGSRLARASAKDGRVVWDRTLAGRLGQPTLARDRVLVGSTDDHLYAIDAEDGDLAWKYRAFLDGVGAAGDGDMVFFAARDNVLRALNYRNGNQRWKALLTTRAPVPPVALGGTVIVHGLSPALSTFSAATGAVTGTYEPPAEPKELVGPALIDPVPRPFRVALVAITADVAIGLRPAQMMFREPPPVALPAVPGRPLSREVDPVTGLSRRGGP